MFTERQKAMLRLKQLSKVPTFWLAWLAAMLYCSWPLGYVLNPALGHRALASQLEAPHQPYSWVFVALDVLTGVVVLVIGLLQITTSAMQTVLRWCVLSYMAFGVLVVVAALSPLHCDPTIQSCGPLLHNPLLVLHGVCSILSVLFLFLSVGGLLRPMLRFRVSWAAHLIIVIVVIAWAAFGAGALVAMWRHIGGNLLQNYFITVCGASLIIITGMVEYLHRLDHRPLLPEVPFTKLQEMELSLDAEA